MDCRAFVIRSAWYCPGATGNWQSVVIGRVSAGESQAMPEMLQSKLLSSCPWQESLESSHWTTRAVSFAPYCKVPSRLEASGRSLTAKGRISQIWLPVNSTDSQMQMKVRQSEQKAKRLVGAKCAKLILHILCPGIIYARQYMLLYGRHKWCSCLYHRHQCSNAVPC